MINVANCFCKRERRRDTERWSLPFAVVSVTRLGYFWKVLATKFPTKETRNTRWLFELFFKQKLSTKNRLILGSGCGSVGRAVASNSGGPWFESSHQQKFILNIYCQLKKTTKIKKKRPGMAHFLKKSANFNSNIWSHWRLLWLKSCKDVFSWKNRQNGSILRSNILTKTLSEKFVDTKIETSSFPFCKASNDLDWNLTSFLDLAFVRKTISKLKKFFLTLPQL